MSRYAISDIHGCANTFRHLVEDVIRLQSTDQLFLLGDYIDRGPDSKGVIDYILNLQEQGYNVKTLSGNHEYMLLQALKEETYLNSWLWNGGKETLASFQATTIHDIPERYWKFFTELEYYVETEDYLLVHAGFNFAAENPFQDFYNMLWIRNFAVDYDLLGSRKIVHGHTPTPVVKINERVADAEAKVINIDSGCVYRQVLGLAYLTAFNLDTLTLEYVPNQEA
ncbi:metallophosphoesterase family protein [Adhaeribacter aquaticus]|uniref:metallophosphoesterase family protein n=1 Tax=Adhaeribacter aquaticus TaxID=299567 RepID=UPI00041F47C6|nr:metallophosphoesterase family protein [Adhaeribacter aquaticus]